MPSHVAGKPDKSHEAADQARLPGVRLILPLQKEEALLFFFFSLFLQVVPEETR